VVQQMLARNRTDPVFAAYLLAVLRGADGALTAAPCVWPARCNASKLDDSQGGESLGPEALRHQATTIECNIGIDIGVVEGCIMSARDLGFAWQLTRDRKYAARGISELRRAAEWPLYPFLMMANGYALNGLAFGFDWLYDAMTLADRGRSLPRR
jgi:hypothetical protein